VSVCLCVYVSVCLCVFVSVCVGMSVFLCEFHSAMTLLRISVFPFSSKSVVDAEKIHV